MHTHVGWKQTTVELTCSRDGRHWSRAGKRQEVIPLGARSQWDADYHDPCWDPIPVGNELWIYYRSVNRGPDDRNPKVGHVIGLAKLRRDGFASVNAGDEPGTVVTRPLTFQGRALYVNAEAGEGGYVKAEIRTRSGKPLPSHGLDRCEPLATDTVASRVVWAGAQTIDCAGERSVRLAFELKNAKLYSFWIE